MSKTKELESSGNAVYSLMYHLIIVVKYRKEVFVSDKITERCKDIIKNLVNENKCEIANIECGSDHIHVLLKTRPSTDIPKLVNVIKGHSSRVLREEFADELKDSLVGPNAFAFSTDATAPARVLAKFAKKHKNLILKSGIVEGKVVDEATMKELSLLPNREGMLSMLLSCLQSPVSSFARVVKAVADAKEAGTPAQASEAKAEETPAVEAAA